jgi:hypothetical protein
MSLSNLEYLYEHLPARNRRTDRENAFFWKRFLTFFGQQCDSFDLLYDNFYKNINPATASEEFIHFWLYVLFGWSWYPDWFSLERKRRLFGNFAQHLARRGSPLGIEEFLKEFSIFARCYARPLYWGEFVWGEADWTILAPGGIVVQISHLADEVNYDTAGNGWGEFVWGEGFFADQKATLTNREIEDLLRFQQPASQQLMIDYMRRDDISAIAAWNDTDLFFNEDLIPDENTEPVIDWTGE